MGRGHFTNSSPSPETTHLQGDLFHPNETNLPTPGATNPSSLPATHIPCSAKGSSICGAHSWQRGCPCSQGVELAVLEASDPCLSSLDPTYRGRGHFHRAQILPFRTSTHTHLLHIITEPFSLASGAHSIGFKQLSLWGVSLWSLSSEIFAVGPRPLSMGPGALSIGAFI